MEYNFSDFFKRATSHEPYPYQTNFAVNEKLFEIIDVPTGLGKTEAVIAGWLWRLLYSDDKIKEETPKRLIYCLPMRSLSEQTYNIAKKILERLDLLGVNENNKISVNLLIGGDFSEIWDLYPEVPRIIIGTQDMLLSRALNRGYGMSRYRWPIDFGVLNNDCLWVFDEIQLMGSGFTTSMQLQGLREKLGTIKPVKSIWMSATVTREFKTYNYEINKNLNALNLDSKDQQNQNIKNILSAQKTIDKTNYNIKNINQLADDILLQHSSKSEEGNTIVILNTVKKVVELYKNLVKNKNNKNNYDIIMINSHFREPDKQKHIESLYSGKNKIIVSTQVIEAGIDISSNLLFTELAPWESLIQRFGRCNRRGEFINAKIFWIPLPDRYTNLDLLPYIIDEINFSMNKLENLNKSAITFNDLQIESKNEVNFTLREKDVIELYSTDVGITGYDLDISMYVRSDLSVNAFVFWRNYNDLKNEKFPSKSELCPVPLSDLIDQSKKKNVYSWDWLDGMWVKTSTIIPGNFYMLHSKYGLYNSEYGWDVGSKKFVNPIDDLNTKKYNQTSSYEDNNTSQNQKWQSLEEHTNEVVKKGEYILCKLNLTPQYQYYNDIICAMRWHDTGKVHPEFQKKINLNNKPVNVSCPVAKAPPDQWRKTRSYFRHELASGLLALENNKSNLVAYLAASHHGKIRASIRSLDKENQENGRVTRGIKDNDKIPAINITGINIPETNIKLSYMNMGISDDTGESWNHRVYKLYSIIGIFRLAYMEMVVRAADQRASGGLP